MEETEDTSPSALHDGESLHPWESSKRLAPLSVARSRSKRTCPWGLGELRARQLVVHGHIGRRQLEVHKHTPRITLVSESGVSASFKSSRMATSVSLVVEESVEMPRLMLPRAGLTSYYINCIYFNSSGLCIDSSLIPTHDAGCGSQLKPIKSVYKFKWPAERYPPKPCCGFSCTVLHLGMSFWKIIIRNRG